MAINNLEIAQSLINDVVHDANLARLLGQFGFEGVDSGGNVEKLAAIKAFTNEVFDFRRSTADKFVERWQSVEPKQINDDPSLHQLVFDATSALAGYNLVGSTYPSVEAYDSAWILGAANKTPLTRINYFMPYAGKVGTLFLLGSGRVLQPPEQEKAGEYAPNALREFDLMDGAAKVALNVREVHEEEFNSKDPTSRDFGKMRTYRTESGIDVVTVWAPAVEGTGRANTADAYRFVNHLDRTGKLEKLGIAGVGRTALSVTNAQYTLFQHADFIRLVGLPNSARTEIVGYDAAYGGTTRKAHELLQEVNSGINSLSELQRAITV